MYKVKKYININEGNEDFQMNFPLFIWFDINGIFFNIYFIYFLKGFGDVECSKHQTNTWVRRLTRLEKRTRYYVLN